jgi:hypothetical protein
MQKLTERKIETVTVDLETVKLALSGVIRQGGKWIRKF